MVSEKLLSDFIEEISMGPFGSDITIDNYVSSGVPVLNGSNVSGFKLTEDSFNYVTEDKAKSFRKAIARRGDVVITHRGTLGQIAYIPENSQYEKYVISQSQFRIRFSKAIDPRYLVYLFHTEYGQKKLLSFKNHVGVPALAQATTNFRNLKIALHEIEEQKRIADVISVLENKIELNNRINAELEAMAKTIYDYWFVQFDFPDKNGKPYKSSGGKMVWNEELKREIPKGWEVKSLFAVCQVQYGFPFSTNYFNEERDGIPVIRIRDILENTISNYSTESEIDEKYLIKKGDLLIGMDGNFHINYWSVEGCYLNQRVVKLSETNLPNIYLKYQVEPYIKLREQSVSRTTVGHLSDKDLKAIRVLVPDKETLSSFKNLYKKSLEKIIHNKKENQQLASLRDWLLPMLMNGQVKVN